MVGKVDRAKQWAGALLNGGEARNPQVGDYSSSAAARLSKQRAVDAHDGGYIVTGFGEGRNAAAVALDRVLTGVIRCQRQFQIIGAARPSGPPARSSDRTAWISRATSRAAAARAPPPGWRAAGDSAGLRARC